MLKFYGYAKCSTCKKAQMQLQQNKVEYQYIDITTHPPNAQELKKFFRQSGLPFTKFFNTSGQAYRELNIKEQVPNLTVEKAAELMAQNGRLIKRPLISDGQEITVGFKEEEIQKKWRK